MLAKFSFQGIWDSCVSFGLAIWEYCTSPWMLGALALTFILLLVLFILSKRQPSRIRAFSNSNGYVEISRSALIDIIRSTSEQVDIEKKPGVQIMTKRGKLHVDVKIRLLPTRRLTEVSEILQNHLIETLEEGLGIRRLGNINVVVVGVRAKSSKDIRASLPLYRKSEEEKEDVVSPVEVVDDSNKAQEIVSVSVSEKEDRDESKS